MRLTQRIATLMVVIVALASSMITAACCASAMKITPDTLATTNWRPIVIQEVSWMVIVRMLITMQDASLMGGIVACPKSMIWGVTSAFAKKITLDMNPNLILIN